ncbi:hypothetical protein ABER12_12075 [Cutibacterium acnes]|jgi:hypothetical protein|uniref:Uncharacterized protein n=2 Tax=Bacillati TaxID=1783272 RepID=A7VNM4_9FIRM|nr:hypothetical protein [Cutibacterium acnes]EDO63068.1 hypothetical protein CLOLEP_00149 [[Clostridium] leptum DSM 753]OFL45924.1 hypothetical protein HMPREF2768_00060 [Propionibacterium sp. HMSC068C01]RFT44637.1 hypothetical protein CHT93_10840 [Staphylococcus epidermidis]EFT64522.1 hypothetical protein HMPREF9578_01276 [Cutibacterium acnes HL110PA4]MCK6135287.1 hypothetical protein [Cutibacterium acnes]
MMTDLDLAKKQITWLAAHLRSRIVDERGGGSSTVETLIWIGLVVATVVAVGAVVMAFIKSKMPH